MPDFKSDPIGLLKRAQIQGQGLFPRETDSAPQTPPILIWTGPVGTSQLVFPSQMDHKQIRICPNLDYWADAVRLAEMATYVDAACTKCHTVRPLWPSRNDETNPSLKRCPCSVPPGWIFVTRSASCSAPFAFTIFSRLSSTACCSLGALPAPLLPCYPPP